MFLYLKNTCVKDFPHEAEILYFLFKIRARQQENWFQKLHEICILYNVHKHSIYGKRR
jgi:hypothetical protein